jgi:hypothetical protein
MDVRAQERGAERSLDGRLERLGVAQSLDFVRAQGALPRTEQQLHFPADSLQFGDVVSGKERARQGRQVVPVLSVEGHAHHARHRASARLVAQLDIQVEHRLLVHEAERDGVVETHRSAVVVHEKPARARRAVRAQGDGIGLALEPLQHVGAGCRAT